MANIEGHYDQNAKAQESVSTGDHKAEVVESEIKQISQKNDVGNNLTLTWKIIDGPDAGSLIWQKLNMFFTGNNAQKVIQIANSQFAQVREATGVHSPVDTTELHNRPCIITVGPQKNAPEYQEVKKVKAMQNGQVSQSAISTQETGVGAANGASNPFARPNTG